MQEKMASNNSTYPRKRSTGNRVTTPNPTEPSDPKKHFQEAVARAVRFEKSNANKDGRPTGQTGSSATRRGSSLISEFDWSSLIAQLKLAEEKEQKQKDLEASRPKKTRSQKTVPAGDEKKERKCLTIFYRRAHCLFTGNMFFRHPYRIITLLEIGFSPLFVLVIFLAFTSGVSWRKTYSEIKEAEKHRPYFAEIGEAKFGSAFRNEFMDINGRIFLAYAPNNNFTRTLILKTLKNLGIAHQNQFRNETGKRIFGAIGVKDHAEVIRECMLHRMDHRLYKHPVGVTFVYDPEKISGITGLPTNVTFAISTFHPMIAATSESHPYVDPPRSEQWLSPYIKSGFLGLQVYIENAYITLISQKLIEHQMADLNKSVGFNDLNDMRTSRQFIKMFTRDPSSFPSRKLKMVFFPSFFNTTIRTLVKNVICFALVIAYASISYFIVQQVVREHESGIKDLLKMHSLPTYMHWVILAVHTLLFRTITAALVTLTFFIDYSRGSMFRHSNPFVIFIFLWLHLLAQSSFNFFLATTLSSVAFSGVYSVTICFLSYLIPLTLSKAGLVPRVPNIVMTSLLPNWAMTNGISQIVEFESSGQGVDWEHLYNFVSKLPKQSVLSLSLTVILLGASAIIYFILAVLEDLGRQRKLSTSIKWYHLIERYRSYKHKKKFRNALANKDEEVGDVDDYEKPLIYEEFQALHKSIAQVRNLSKTYGKHKLVLDNVSMNVGVGEITVVLGPGDSGKSTLILCLAGMVSPTTGSVYVNGYNVHTEIAKARKCMGLCPQELIVFNLLTVNDHLVLCFRLRGLPMLNANQKAGELLNMLRLYDVRNRKPSYLTNNEKRKLVIAMCLVDAPSVILLDEPTNGMDFLARREIWDILKNLKKDGHTIVISTNMIDEAEYLADRIALLSHGKLICYGTPRFLKQQYDTGYILRIIPDPVTFKIENVNKVAEQHLGQRLKESTKKQMTDSFHILLELPKNKISSLPFLFDELDKNKKEMGILSYSVEQVSLSDIFTHICESVGAESNAPDMYLRRNSKEDWTSSLAQEIPSIPTEENFEPKIWHHMLALLHKRWICVRNRNQLLFWEYVIPLILILAAVWNSHVFITQLRSATPRTFRLEDFPQARVYLRMTSEVNEKYFLGWTALARLVLGNFSEELLAKDAILTRIYDDLKSDSLHPNFTLEKRMIALERRKTGGARSSATSPSQFTGYFSSGSLHSPPLIMNIISNILLLGLTQDPHNDSYRINVINSPLPTTADNPLDKSCDVSCIIFATIISFACGILLAALIPFPIDERRNGMKQLQLMAGVHPMTYWLSEFLFDLGISIVITVIIAIIFTVDIHKSYNETGVQTTLIFIMFLFLCWAGLPWVYYLSTIVHVKLNGYNFAIWLHILLGPVATMTLEAYFFSKKNLVIIIVRWLFHLFPPYSFTLALFTWFHAVSVSRTCHEIPEIISEVCSISNKDIIRDIEMKEVYKFVIAKDINLAKCCPRICKPTNSCYEFPKLLSFSGESVRHAGIVGDLFALSLQGLLYWALLIVYEKRFFERLLQAIVFKFMASQERRRKGKIPELQPDIKSEKERVSGVISKGHIPAEIALVCQDLTKSYATQMVINNVNMEVKKGECISLLGGGGSGKTSIMKMLSGGIIPTRGTVYIGNTNLHQNRKKYLSSIGYCPQTNCLFDGFTGIQMLELMGRLKGVPSKLLTVHIKKWLQILGIESAGKDKCVTYTSSMKRRLCGAMALIGGNPILLFDEPTTGVDPFARQRFWGIIRNLTMKGHSVIFTSFNVEECRALSTRILVLSEGNVQCVGSPLELQERFSKGYTLLLRLRYDSLTPMEMVSTSIGRITELKATVEKKFRHVTLRDEQDNLLLYFLRDTKLTWGELFRKAEELKRDYEHILEKYFISQASLEDIFILLTNKYRELDKPRTMEPGDNFSNLDAEQAAIESATKALS